MGMTLQRMQESTSMLPRPRPPPTVLKSPVALGTWGLTERKSPGAANEGADGGRYRGWPFCHCSLVARDLRERIFVLLGGRPDLEAAPTFLLRCWASILN